MSKDAIDQHQYISIPTAKDVHFEVDFTIIQAHHQWEKFYKNNTECINRIALDAFKSGQLILNKKCIYQINIILCNNTHIHALNKQYRHIDKATNVLSFPIFDRNELINKDYLFADMQCFGDVYISYDYCVQEATTLNISFKNHIAHMIIHGILHLLGYDHIEDHDAKVMTMLEINILQKFNIDNPYKIL